MKMMLKLLSVLLLTTSTVIAYDSSLDSGTCLTSQAPKYLNFDKGFFYIQGLSNGESVVMSRIPNEKIIKVQYIFTNSDSFYEIRTYNIIENGTVVNYAKVEKKERKFSIRKTLSFKLNGKDVEIKYKINEKGFELLQSIEGTTIETSELSEPTNGSVPLTGFNVSNEIPYDVKDKHGGYFYQKTLNNTVINGTYTFFTLCFEYFTINYTIENPFEDNCRINVMSYRNDFESNPEYDPESSVSLTNDVGTIMNAKPIIASSPGSFGPTQMKSMKN